MIAGAFSIPLPNLILKGELGASMGGSSPPWASHLFFPWPIVPLEECGEATMTKAILQVPNPSSLGNLGRTSGLTCAGVAPCSFPAAARCPMRRSWMR